MKSGVSSRCAYACQISLASPARALSVGSISAKCPRMFRASRWKYHSARLLCDAEIACGKSMIVGPWAPQSTLYGDRSPWMSSHERIFTSCDSMS
jgi:hypothetical protein